MFCIDASVLISAARGTEPSSEQSQKFLKNVREERHNVFLPAIVLPEVASGLMRATKRPDVVEDFILALRAIPNFVFVPIDDRIASRAVDIITATALRSADALYVALSIEYKLVLITLDREQMEKGRRFIEIRLP